MSKIAAIIGRIFLGLIFIVSGAGKLLDPASAQQMVAMAGLPGSFAIPVGIFELIAGLCLAIGFMTRLVAILLIVFTALTILFAHNQFTDPAHSAHALKNLAIIGGLLLAFAHSHMWHHYDTIRRERRGEIAARDAEHRAHEAELRAARAEAAVEAARTHPVDTHAIRTDHHVAATDWDGDGISDHRRKRRWFQW